MSVSLQLLSFLSLTTSKVSDLQIGQMLCESENTPESVLRRGSDTEILYP